MGRQPLGVVLRDTDIISETQLAQALDASEAWAVPLGQAVLALGFASPPALYGALARHLNLPFFDVLKTPPPTDLFDPALLDFYQAAEAIPVRREGARLMLATPDPLLAAREIALRRARGLPAPEGDLSFAITARLDVLWTIQRQFGDTLQHRARLELDERAPEFSARGGVTRAQGIGLSLLVLAFVLGLVTAPMLTAAIVSTLLGIVFVSLLGLRALSVPIGLASQRRRVDNDPLPDDPDLPVYTILVPLYQEADVLPLLARALRRLDYPRAKLDIKLVLEADDHDTIAMAKHLGLGSYMELIQVPPSQPRTKPKACNYALQFARGDYVVIFDAEDQPEPLQLKRAVAMFKRAGPEIACLQAPLTYFNATENWLTRQFTIEFNMWFDLLLPTIERLGMPIPLGGTSTHFRIDPLREVCAWDPYNVTEDADLGIRFAQRGYKCAILNSTTYEEANCQLGNWLRQRSRWLKGYAQTWMVHMRRPISLWRTLGPVGFLGFHLMIGGTLVSALAHPLVWIAAAVGFAFNGSALAGMTAPEVPLLLILFNMTLVTGGYAISVAAGIAAVRGRHMRELVPHVFLMVFYWPLLSAGAYLAMWQLVTKPHYWEKTQHAISRASRAQLAQLARHSALQEHGVDTDQAVRMPAD
jgi:cellulose synthase/poly-beta-1,6-N-acetylglucosamine synthase-like glycosyltransferase